MAVRDLLLTQVENWLVGYLHQRTLLKSVKFKKLWLKTENCKCVVYLIEANSQSEAKAL